MKKRMKHFQKEEFDLDGAGPAQPSGGPPYIRWPFRWACCIYLTFICLPCIWLFFKWHLPCIQLFVVVVDIFTVFFVHIANLLRGLHLLNVCLTLFYIYWQKNTGKQITMRENQNRLPGSQNNSHIMCDTYK